MIKAFYLGLFIMICTFAAASSSSAGGHALIKSMNLRQINKIIDGFGQSCPDARVTVMDPEEKNKKSKRKIERFIKKENPELIVCLGSLAAKLTAGIVKDIPVIFCLVINHKR